MSSSASSRSSRHGSDCGEEEQVTGVKKKKDDLEIFNQRIKEIKYEREDVQKKTFCKWVNSMLAKGKHPPVKDLFNDLRDGTKLLALLEVLTNKEFKREKGRMRVHHLNNVSRALKVLEENNVRLVNISNNDIVDGNAKITLGLAWSIFLNWQVNDIMKELMASMHQSNLEKALLAWCQQNTKPYPGVEIKNFTTSWSDGLAFTALIHRWRPEIIDFAAVTSKSDANERLDAAFSAAQEFLGIERLLDVEDLSICEGEEEAISYTLDSTEGILYVNTSVPDKKSVMMYVMCLFQALAQSGLEPPPLPSTETLEAAIVAAKLEEEAANPSLELSSYQGIVEEVLSWLLIADDRVAAMGEISTNLPDVKTQFHTHEKFMLSLTEHQGDVGEVLQEGSRILQEGKLPAGEMEQVRAQMKLLNTKWEDLRVKAMDRQNGIHEKLMSLQLGELEALKEFLTETEDRISRMATAADMNSIDEKIREQEELHEDILKQQQRVLNFSNLVVVVDEQGDKEFANMEDQLAALSERWTHICGWTEKRGGNLKKLKSALPKLIEKEKDLGEWLKVQEKRLKEMEANPETEGSLMERYDKIQILQREMEEKVNEISELSTTLHGFTDDAGTLSTSFIASVETLEDRWEALKGIMEAQSQRMVKYGQQSQPKSIDMIDIIAISKQDYPKAKRAKMTGEWESGSGIVNEWVMRTAGLIGTPGAFTFDELSVDEQLMLWEDLHAELLSNEEVYDKASRDADELVRHIKNDGQDTTELEKDADELRRKWTDIRSVLDERKILIDGLLVKKEVEGDISNLSNSLSAYERWLESQGEVSPISAQPKKFLEQARVKMKTLKSHDPKIQKLKSKQIQDPQLATQVESFLEKWKNIETRLEERLNALVTMLEMSEDEKMSESASLVLHWVNRTESFLLEESPPLDLLAMKAFCGRLESMVVEARAHEGNLAMLSQSEELKGRYEEVAQLLTARHSQVSSLLKRVEQWQAEMCGLESWLEEVDVFNSEMPAFGDLDLLEAQLEQSNALLEDIRTLSPKYESLSSEGRDLLQNVDVRSGKSRLFKLSSHWGETVRKAESQNSSLRSSYEKSKEVLCGIDDLNEFLNGLSRDVPQVKISSPADLARFYRKFTALKERVDKREPTFRSLNEKGTELLLLPSQDSCKGAIQELGKTFTHLNSKWNEVTGIVDRNWKDLKEAMTLYGDFRSRCAQESDWLDRLDKKLKKPVTSAADMEEISDDLDGIEQYIGPEPAARFAKLEEIGSELIDGGILSAAIQTDMDLISKRWNLLNQKAEERRSELEGELVEAVELERRIAVLSDGLDSSDRLLSARLEHDLPSDDVNSEQLADEMKQQAKILEDMTAQVEAYKKAGKHEAAARLLEQSELLHKKHADVSKKYSKFTSPPPEFKIVPKIERIWRSLRQVEQNLCFLELVSDDPENIQGQLGRCTKEYGVLSDLKREVEAVLKEGRRQVEDKKQESKLNSELDSMKALYNKVTNTSKALGLQIANIRGALEKGLKIATEMNEGMNEIENWISQKPSQDKDLRVRVEELPRMNKLVNEMNKNFDGFLKLVDPLLLDTLKERKAEIIKNWEDESQEIVKKYKESFTQPPQVPEAEIKDFESWLLRIENLLYTSEFDGQMDIQGLKEEVYERRDDLEALRVQLFNLIVLQKDPLSSENEENILVEKLTRRLDTISNQLKSLSSFALELNSGISNPAFDEEDDDSFENHRISEIEEELLSNLRGNDYEVFDQNQRKPSDLKTAGGKPMEDKFEEEDDESSSSSREEPTTISFPSSAPTVVHQRAAEKREEKRDEEEGNVKIVEIKRNEIVQGILRMEPKMGSKVAIVKVPCVSSNKSLASTMVEMGEEKEEGNPEFEKDAIEVEKALSNFANRLEQLQREPNLRERIEGIELELRSVEPEVALAISKGSSLIFKLDLEKANATRRLIENLSKEWLRLKAKSETYRVQAMKAEGSEEVKEPAAKKKKSSIPVRTESKKEPERPKERPTIEKMESLEKTEDLDIWMDKVEKLLTDPDPSLISQLQEKITMKHSEVMEHSNNEIGLRWRNLLDEMNQKDKIGKWWEPHVILRDWVEKARSVIDSPIPISDESALRNMLSSLKILEHEVLGKKPELEKLERKQSVTPQEIDAFRSNIDKLSVEIPPRRKLVEQKLGSLRKLGSSLDNTASWLLELRAQVATAKHRPNNEKAVLISSLLNRLEDKESEVVEVIRNYKNCELEAEVAGQSMTPQLKEKLRQLKEDCVYVKSKGEINVVTNDIESLFLPFSESLPAEKKEGDQPDLQLQISHQIDEMTLSLKSLKQQAVAIGDVDDVRGTLEKQRTVLRELELKRPQLEELLQTAETLKSEAARVQLHGKVRKLREHWGETNSAVILRLKELEDCLQDSINWESRWKELLHILSLEGDGLDQHTVEGLVREFEDVSERLVFHYKHDDPSRIKGAVEDMKRVKSSWISRRNDDGRSHYSSLHRNSESNNTLSSTYSSHLERGISYDKIKDDKDFSSEEIERQRWPVRTTAAPPSGASIGRARSHLEETLLSLRELTEWVIGRETDLGLAAHLASDQASMQRQLDEHRAFRRLLDGKRPLIEKNLLIARQLGNENFDQNSNSDLSRNVKREVVKLNETWSSLIGKSDDWNMRLEDALHRMKTFQQMLDDASARLATAEAIKTRWSTIAAAADKSSLLDQFKTFREHISCTERAVNEVNAEAPHVTLTKLTASRVDELNKRLKNLEANVAEREQELNIFLPERDSVHPPWERALNAARVPYFINHDTETTQWDHPKMSEILDGLSEFNDVRFSAYRTALKLRSVQKETKMDTLSLKSVIETFERLGLRGGNDRILDVVDMSSTFKSLYKASSDMSLVVDLGLNWVLNVFDTQRTGQVRNLSFKVALVLMSKGAMEDKFRYLFGLVANAEKQVDQRKLGLLLHDCMQIPRQFGEVAAFGGSNIEPSVRSCFEKSRKEVAINMGDFLDWVKKEPQSLVWLPVLHRIAASEKAIHQAKCNCCKEVPIVGLRYRCLKCFNFDMCQTCFFSGKKRKNHKLTHPMQEYCVESTSSEDMRDFTKALKNRFKSKRSLLKHRKLGYLPVQTVLEGDMLESPAPSPQHSLSPDTLRLADVRLRNNSTPDSEDEHSLIAQYCASLTRGSSFNSRSPIQIVAGIEAEQSHQLNAVIQSLEAENAALQSEYERLRVKNGAAPPCETAAEASRLRNHKGVLEARMAILEDHNRQLEGQLQRLRQLLDEPAKGSGGTGTLQSKSVVAAELDIRPVNGNREAVELPPPTPGYGATVEDLLNRAGELGNAVAELVTVFTDDEADDDHQN